jgi:hypothetical protein
VFRELAPWMIRRFGAPAVRDAFATLPKDLAKGFDVNLPALGALPSTWYDARVYQITLDALLDGQPHLERVALARDAARSVLEQTLRGIYAKLFALMASPPLYARYAQKMWDTHYDTGKVTIEHTSPSVAFHRVRGWAGHHPFVCAVNRQSGAIVYQMMELRNVRIERESCAPPVCEAVYAWDP